MLNSPRNSVNPEPEARAGNPPADDNPGADNPGADDSAGKSNGRRWIIGIDPVFSVDIFLFTRVLIWGLFFVHEFP